MNEKNEFAVLMGKENKVAAFTGEKSWWDTTAQLLRVDRTIQGVNARANGRKLSMTIVGGVWKEMYSSKEFSAAMTFHSPRKWFDENINPEINRAIQSSYAWVKWCRSPKIKGQLWKLERNVEQKMICLNPCCIDSGLKPDVRSSCFLTFR